MQTNLPDHIPEDKQKEIQQISELVKQKANVEMIILFGSFARGDWVSDKYKESEVLYEYQSDFDLLVVVADEKLEKNHSLWNELEREILTIEDIETSVNLIVDTVDFVNARILEGNYFYTDIKREGVLLFDSKRFTLSEVKPLSPDRRRALALRDFEFWFGKAESFYKDYLHNVIDNELSNAAFHLHQVTEALFVSGLLVYTGYKPKTHDLRKIETLLSKHIPELPNVFPKETEKEKRLFDLLKKAYVDARYKMDYAITKEELSYLDEKIQILKILMEKSCEKKIKSFV